MTQQLDMVPLDAAALEHAAEQQPKARQVAEPRLIKQLFGAMGSRYPFGSDVGHELVLPERAREDHR